MEDPAESRDLRRNTQDSSEKDTRYVSECAARDVCVFGGWQGGVGVALQVAGPDSWCLVIVCAPNRQRLEGHEGAPPQPLSSHTSTCNSFPGLALLIPCVAIVQIFTLAAALSRRLL